MPDTKTYKVGKQVYDIPVEKADAFLSKYSDAIEVESFLVEKDTFDIPLDKVDKFKGKFPQAKSLKKKDDTFVGSELDSEALSTSTKEDFIKQQLDLQEPAFSTAVNKQIQEQDIPEQKPMSMETFEDIMVDVKEEKQERIQAEEDKKLFEEFEKARTKLHKEVSKEEAKEKTKELLKDGIVKRPPEEIKEKFESGELEQADFFPDGNYFYGYLKNVNRSTASFFRKLDGGDKLLNTVMSKATGGAIPEEHQGMFGKVADWVDEKANKGLAEVPDDVVGGAIGMFGHMNMFPAELMLTPNAKIKALSTVTGGAINGIPKLATLLGVGGGLEEYSLSGDAKKSATKAVQGFSDGLFLTMLVGIAGKIGMTAAKNPLNQQLISTGINAGGFAGKSAAEQYEATGKIDPVEVASQATFAAVLSAPEIAKITDTYFTSTKNTVRSIENMKVNYKKLTNEYRDLIKEERNEGTTSERRTEIKIAKDGIQNLISMKFAVDDVRSNPDKYREIVEKDNTLNEQERKFQLDKIDYIQKEAKEIKPKQIKEGISEPLDVTEKPIEASEAIKTEKTTKSMPEKKEVVKKAEIIEPIKKEAKDEIKEVQEKADKKVIQEKAVKEGNEVVYKTKEDFKKDFLSDDVNLESIDVPLKMKDKMSAAKNLREGKETAQGKILESYLDESFKRGKLDLITADKKTRTAAELTDIVTPKKEPVAKVEAKKVKIPEEELERMKAEEVGKPDEYQTLDAKDESGQQDISIRIGIDKNNNIDVTKANSKKEANKLIKQKAKEMDKELSTLKGDVKNEIIKRRKAINLETFETNLYTHDLEKKFTKEQREAITFLLEKQGIPEKMVSDKVKEAHDNPTPEMKQAVKEVRERYDKAWEYISENTDKMSVEQVKDYVTHLWKIPNKKMNDVVTWFTTKNKFTNKRVIESMKEGMEKFGLEPQTTDISEILRVYESAKTNAVENKKFVDVIQSMDKDGVRMLLKQNEAPEGWVEIKHPALSYKTYIPSAEPGKASTVHKSYYKVHPDIKRSLEAVLESGTLSNSTLEKIAKGYEGISGFMKKVNLSVSLFHHQALTETAIAQTGLPKTLKTLGKDLLWDGIKEGKPAFKNPEITRDAIKHTVQLGATQDIPVKNIAKGLEKLADKAKGIPVAEQLAKGLAKGNEKWDAMLWEYLHDGLKIYGYEHLAGQVRGRALKEGWTEKQTDKALDEVGQLVNDTYGGQNWDILGVSAKQQRALSWMLLSPDWTTSTVRQALSPTGFGALYKNDKFWKEAATKGTPANARAKAGRNFWIKAALYYGVGMNLLNVMNRLQDEKENPDDYPNKDKPLKGKIEDYSMFGNTIGHNTHLFTGRYDDGSEKYLRWGKQFRELPELLMDEEGVSFPKPALKKIGGKANPLLQYGTQLMTGKTLSGFENWDLRDKKGWEWTQGALKLTAKSAFPYSTATAFRADKEWSPTDLFMPASKGMTPSKAISLYEKGLSYEDGFNADSKYIEEVYQGAIANNLDALSLFKIAARNKEAEATMALKKDIKSIADIDKKLKEDLSPIERDKLIKERDKLIDRKIKIQDARINFIEVEDYLTDKEIEYFELENE